MEEVGLSLRTPLGESWGIFRREQTWVAEIVGNFNYPFPGFVNRELPETPERLVTQTAVNWDEIKKGQPHAIDAFISPEGQAILIQTEDQLLLYSYEGENIQGKPVWQLELKDKEKLIMVKWFAGEQQAQWDRQIQSVYQTKNFRFPGYYDKPVYAPQ